MMILDIVELYKSNIYVCIHIFVNFGYGIIKVYVIPFIFTYRMKNKI